MASAESLEAAGCAQGASDGAALSTPSSHHVSLTVRTLDKTEHKMSVAYDISVSQLKDEVAIVTSIDAGSQVVPPAVRVVCPRSVRALHTSRCCVWYAPKMCPTLRREWPL